ncbi:hypothetical protein NQ317_013511 [Molorchus minor]|uniref:Fatty acyl-CoA reductase n=1 Tax=Molorchus minor TaxID=1323400 RepID=A0ABQ9JX85_9CUCU|nr:hypothetical protein NQ317_013511 [Molorchus minor]
MDLLLWYSKAFPEEHLNCKAIINILGEKLSKLIEDFNKVDDSVYLDESNLTPIQEFYKDTTVFITGCTGFLGHVLLQKLLRSCPVSKIYVLARAKKGKELEKRMEEMFEQIIFQRVADQRYKVVAMEGDCERPNLGLGEEDRNILIKEVDIVFHVAATVRFDAKLKTAIRINIKATRDLLRRGNLPPAANYEGIIGMVESFEDEVLEKITPTLIGKYPNTYTYSKQIAEDVVKQEGEGLPVGIQRPAIVTSTFKEPVRGWLNNIYGPTGVVLGAGLGLLRVLHFDEELEANFVPVDMCVNSMIVSAWDAAECFQEAQRRETKVQDTSLQLRKYQ